MNREHRSTDRLRRRGYRPIERKEIPDATTEEILYHRKFSVEGQDYIEACDREIRKRYIPKIYFMIDMLLPEASKQMRAEIVDFYRLQHSNGGYEHSKEYDEWFTQWLTLHLLRRKEYHEQGVPEQSFKELRKGVPAGANHFAIMVGEDLHSYSRILSTILSLEKPFGEMLHLLIESELYEPDIAKIYGISQSTVRFVLHRATEMYIQCMKDSQDALLEASAIFRDTFSFADIEHPEYKVAVAAGLTAVERRTYFFHHGKQLSISEMTTLFGIQERKVKKTLQEAQKKVVAFTQAGPRRQVEIAVNQLRDTYTNVQRVQDLFHSDPEHIKEVMIHLTRDHQRAIELVYIDGEDHAQAAEQCGVSVNTFRHRLYAACNNLLALIREGTHELRERSDRRGKRRDSGKRIQFYFDHHFDHILPLLEMFDFSTQQALLLVYRDRRSIAAVAKQLDIPLTTLKSRLQSARLFLDERMSVSILTRNEDEAVRPVSERIQQIAEELHEEALLTLLQSCYPQIVAQAIKALPPKQQRALKLQCYQHKKNEEIRHIMVWTMKNTSVQLYLGRQAVLQKVFETFDAKEAPISMPEPEDKEIGYTRKAIAAAPITPELRNMWLRHKRGHSFEDIAFQYDTNQEAVESQIEQAEQAISATQYCVENIMHTVHISTTMERLSTMYPAVIERLIDASTKGQQRTYVKAIYCEKKEQSTVAQENGVTTTAVRTSFRRGILSLQAYCAQGNDLITPDHRYEKSQRVSVLFNTHLIYAVGVAELLPPSFQEVLLLKEQHGYDIQAIAENTGRSYKQVNDLLNEARDRFLKLLNVDSAVRQILRSIAKEKSEQAAK